MSCRDPKAAINVDPHAPCWQVKLTDNPWLRWSEWCRYQTSRSGCFLRVRSKGHQNSCFRVPEKKASATSPLFGQHCCLFRRDFLGRSCLSHAFLGSDDSFLGLVFRLPLDLLLSVPPSTLFTLRLFLFLCESCPLALLLF